MIRRPVLRGLEGYERLRSEWISANKGHTEIELLAACAGFARDCGLVLRQEALAATIRELEGGRS